MNQAELYKDLRHNLAVNILDGAFFGFALGFASFVTVLPLFVSTLTDSPILIGLIPSIHAVGWLLPQILTVGQVTRRRQYKPMVLWMTIHERLPFIGLAIAAVLASRLEKTAALWIVFPLLVWQGLGGGFAAAAWQAMVAKIFPADRRGTFYGLQSAAANLLSSLSAVAAGLILTRIESPFDFLACFLLASLSMAISWFFLAQTREPEKTPLQAEGLEKGFWHGLAGILSRDRNFRWFLAVRMLSQTGTMAYAFYTVYVVRQLGTSEVTSGLMTGVFLITQIVASPLMGWLGDRWSHRAMMEIGLFSAAASGLLAWLAPNPAWFFAVFMLAGVSNVAVWTIALAMILEFGSEAERPYYIGLANTLVAPSAIIAPLLGGSLAQAAGYPATFLASSAGAIMTVLVLHFLVKDPRRIAPSKSAEMVN
jgi:MFS family permease